MPANYSIDVLNSIRANASMDYQNRIPAATNTNIAAIGQALFEYEPARNEFANALIHKIGKTIISAKMAKNPFARFKSGGVVSPNDIEEIFVGMAKAEGVYDPDGKNPLGRRTDDNVKSAFYYENRQDKYVTTIGDIDYTKCFKSPARLDAFIAEKINALYSGDVRDEYLITKRVLEFWSGYATYNVMAFEENNSEYAAKSFLKALRKAVYDLTTADSDQYNAAGVVTHSDVSDLVLLVHKDVLVECDVERLSKAFHKSDTDTSVVPTIIPFDGFDSRDKVYGLLMDKDFFRIFDTLFHTESQRNADGLFTNYFLHHHQIYGLSPFFNAVEFIAPNADEGADEPA